MFIKNLKIEGFAALAPMAGVADRAMRELCIESGAAFCMGELTSAKGVWMNDKKSERLLSVSDFERPMGTQLFGCEEKIMAEAAVKALSYHPDFIDINMGCPAPKVASNGGGSGLLKKPDLAGRIVNAVCEAVFPLPVTVKIRSGWDDENKNAVEVAKICEKNGASMITVHGRTRQQGYAPPVDYEIIKQVKNTVNVPVIGNGDIFTPQDAKKMYEKTGCDMIMVGRGANGSPWIFSQINAYLSTGEILPSPPVKERMETLLRQAQLMTKYKDPYIAMLEIRKHAAWYIKGIKGAAGLRRKCMQIKSTDDLNALVREVAEVG